MTKRMDVYSCAACHAMAAMMRGGAGAVSCCGVPMELYQEGPEELGHGVPLPVNTPTMEHNLTMPIKTAINIMQRLVARETAYFGVRGERRRGFQPLSRTSSGSCPLSQQALGYPPARGQ